MRIDLPMKQVLGLNGASHIGIVVKDMEKAINNYSDVFGIVFPKVFVPDLSNKMYRGKPSNYRVKVAIGMMGELQVELVETLEGETIYREFLEKKGEGLHHLGFDVKNIEERIKDLEELGISVLQYGERAGVRFAYLDTEKIVGVMFEFIQREKVTEEKEVQR